MKFILAALCLQLIARPCCAGSVPFPPGINQVVGQHINVLEILTTCNEDLYQTKRSALEDFKLLNKEIKDHIKEHGENCSLASPLTISSISILKRLLCTSYRRPKVVKSVKGAFDGLLTRYFNSLKNCQNSGEEDEIFKADVHPFQAFTDLVPTENPGSRVAVGNSIGEIASTPNSSESKTESNEDSRDFIGGTDNQEDENFEADFHSVFKMPDEKTAYENGSNQPLIINNISLIIAIFIALVALAYVVDFLVHRLKKRSQSR